MRTSPRTRMIRSLASMGLSIVALLAPIGGASAQYLDGPESVTYDALNGRYLISNALSGDIVQITDAGDTTFFDTSLQGTTGITIVDNMLYVVDITGLVRYDLTTDEKIGTTYIPGRIELNDVAADSSGNLYVTDIAAGKIFRVRTSDYTSTPIANGHNLPNGILYDAHNNRVLFCEFIVNAQIKAIDLSTMYVTTVLSTSINRFDGLAMDGAGNIYVSAWGLSSVLRYEPTFSLPPEVVSSGHGGPADIFFNQRDNVLAVPNYYYNRVDLIPIALAGIEGDPEPMARGTVMVQNYPNPFHSDTTIKYHVLEETSIALKIFDVRGREVRTLTNRARRIETEAVVWDGRDNAGRPVGSGIYTCKIWAEGTGTVGSRQLVMVR